MTSLILLVALAQPSSQIPGVPSKRMPELPPKTQPQAVPPVQPTPQRPTPQGAAQSYEYEREPIPIAQLPMTPRIRYRVQRQLIVREQLVPYVEYEAPDVALYDGGYIGGGGFGVGYSGGGYGLGYGLEYGSSFGLEGAGCYGASCGSLGVGAGLFGRFPYGRGWGGRVVDKRVTKFRQGPFGGL